MKRVLLLSTVLMLSISAFGQVEVQKDEFPEYQGVVTVEGKSSSEIYSGLKAWLATSFKSANDVIQLDDKENGKIIAKGNNIVYFTFGKKKYPARPHFTLTLDIKDGRFRYKFEVTDVKDESGANPVSVMSSIINKPTRANVVELREGMSKAYKEFAESMYNSMYAETQDDW